MPEIRLVRDTHGHRIQPPLHFRKRNVDYVAYRRTAERKVLYDLKGRQELIGGPPASAIYALLLTTWQAIGVPKRGGASTESRPNPPKPKIRFNSAPIVPRKNETA